MELEESDADKKTHQNTALLEVLPDQEHLGYE
jgi:hypothetical protein